MRIYELGCFNVLQKKIYYETTRGRDPVLPPVPLAMIHALQDRERREKKERKKEKTNYKIKNRLEADIYETIDFFFFFTARPPKGSSRYSNPGCGSRDRSPKRSRTRPPCGPGPRHAEWQRRSASSRRKSTLFVRPPESSIPRTDSRATGSGVAVAQRQERRHAKNWKCGPWAEQAMFWQSLT